MRALRHLLPYAAFLWTLGFLGLPLNSAPAGRSGVEEAPRRDPGRVTVRRLNRAEYNNTVRDLVGVALRPADDFPVDDAGYGFDNIGDVLSLPPILMEKYMSAADRIARAAIIARPPLEPTLEEYLASRVNGEEGYFSDGAFRIAHAFPADAEYELQIRVVDRRYRPKEGEPPPPLPAPAQMEVWLDGRQVGSFEVEADRYERGTFDLPLRVTSGEHQLYARFLSDGMEGMCCNFQKAASERLVGSIRLRLMHPPRTAC